MPFDPAKPATGSLIASAELRSQLTGLRDQAQADLAGQIAGTARNLNTVAQLFIGISDPPTQGEVQQPRQAQRSHRRRRPVARSTSFIPATPITHHPHQNMNPTTPTPRHPSLLRGLLPLLLCSALGTASLHPAIGAPGDDYPNDPLAKGAGLLIDSVWSGHPVGFSFLTLKDVQVVAYYNMYRQVTLAARNLNSTQWRLLAVRPYSTVAWDSHNYLALSVDANGYLHLSGNLHRQPMNYWRSALPFTNADQLLSTAFMEKLPSLKNATNELQSTYPSFFTGPQEEFLFSYRNHTSDNAGSWYLLKYDTASKTFSQATGTQPLFNWTGNYSVYPTFTVSGGFVHCLFVWRGSSDAATNYNVSYLRSSNLVNWTDAFGRAVTLPVTPTQSLTTIDNVPVQGGLLNGQPKLSFDRDGNPLVTYHKYGAGGFSQVYSARPNTGSTTWKIVQLTSNPDWKWNFSGGGSLPPGGSVGNSFGADDPLDGLATITVSMKRPDGTLVANTGPYLLDETTLNRLTDATNPNTYVSANVPASASAYLTPSPDHTTPDNLYTHNGQSMVVSRLGSSGIAYADQHYYLRWETLPSNRDQPRYESNGVTQISPPASALMLYRKSGEFGTSLTATQSPFYGRMFKPSTAIRGGAMALTNDPKRSFGTFLSSAVGGTANYAEWPFTVPLNRDYALGGSTHSLTSSDDSFYVQMDGGPQISWHVAGRWNYQPVTSNFGMMFFNLAPGTHTLRVSAREAGAKLEHLWLNVASTLKTPSLLPLSQQGFTLTTDPTSTTGYSLGSPPPPASPPAGATAHYDIPVLATGNYLLLGRTAALNNGTADSFYLSINGGAAQTWPIPWSSGLWTWKAFGTTMSLTAGTLTLDVGGREAGAELDNFMLLKVP